VRIDRTHRPWAAASATILAIAVVAYLPYASRSTPPAGGTVQGLVYGGAAFGCMLFVTLLALRKKFPIWRIGRATTWMRGHLWLGALSLPLVLLHAGFGFGHGLSSAMMWLFVVVYASGVAGAWLQHVMPRRLLREVPMETIYEQIGRVREQLLDEADRVVAEASGKLEVAVAAPSAAISEGASALANVMRPGGTADAAAPLRAIYLAEMRPFLQAPRRSHALAHGDEAAALFGRIRALVPGGLLAAVADLESICEEQRQLLRQERLHGWLHAWLIVHVPLSFALMVLAVVHIVAALRY
jgi:hypothetical protein